MKIINKKKYLMNINLKPGKIKIITNDIVLGELTNDDDQSINRHPY